MVVSGSLCCAENWERLRKPSERPSWSVFPSQGHITRHALAVVARSCLSLSAKQTTVIQQQASHSPGSLSPFTQASRAVARRASNSASILFQAARITAARSCLRPRKQTKNNAPHILPNPRQFPSHLGRWECSARPGVKRRRWPGVGRQFCSRNTLLRQNNGGSHADAVGKIQGN